MSDAGSSEAKPKGKRRGLEGVLLLVIFAALIGGMLYMKRPAPMPEAFAKGTLAAANESAQGKPVVAVFTARWCGTCQGYKRGALADAAVGDWLAEHAVAVMIDIDEQPGDAELVGVSAVPTTAVLRDGQVLATQVGAMGADRLRSWLEQTTEVK